MKIEPIAPSDISELIMMYRKGHEESRYKDWVFDEPSVRQAIGRCYAFPGWGVKCVKDNKIIGIYLGCVNAMEFSLQPVGMQVAFYVYPQFRGTRCFYLLIKAFLAWCDEQKAIPFIAPHFFKDNTKTYKMLEKLDLNEFGKIYSKEK